MAQVINDLVGYEKMKIVQDSDWFMFSLDSVLLPNFVGLKKDVKKILDLGTGNAPIPLILSTLTKAKIYGIEIQKDVYELALQSVKINNLEEQITIINDDMKNIDKYFPKETFDVILSNPPYFEVKDKSKLNDVDQKSIARHELKIVLEDIISLASRNLKNSGVFALIHRTDRLIEILELFRKYQLEPKKIRFVHPKEGEESNMVLIEGRKNGGKGLKVLHPLIVHDAVGNYQEEIKKIFNM